MIDKLSSSRGSTNEYNKNYNSKIHIEWTKHRNPREIVNTVFSRYFIVYYFSNYDVVWTVLFWN